MKAFAAATVAMVLALPACGASTPAADAQRWVELIDAGRYDESWAAAGPSFRSQTAKEAWAKEVVAMRKPFGDFVSRKLQREQQTDKDFYAVLFASKFTKDSIVETVLFSRAGTGWRIEGYFIR